MGSTPSVLDSEKPTANEKPPADNRMLLSLDYELFFGANPGTVGKCLIEPTDRLVAVLERYGMKLSLFVDAGFLLKLREATVEWPRLQPQWDLVRSQLGSLSREGHDIQLHIHPHWEDSFFDGDGWVVKTERYRLHDFSVQQMRSIVRRYKSILEEVSGRPVFAYRAGGWCIQPFAEIQQALAENDVWLDSTVFDKGVSEDPVRWFDFSRLPAKPLWRFSSDPVFEDASGCFVEVPISSFPLSPLFYWKMALRKKLSSRQFTPFGDGAAMQANAGYYLSRLTKTVPSPVSVDGIKAEVLGKAYSRHRKNMPTAIFNVMGHPKSLTPYSLASLNSFLEGHPELSAVTFQDLIYLRPAA